MASYREQRQQQRINSARKRYNVFIEKKEYVSAAEECDRIAKMYREFAGMISEDYEGAANQKKRLDLAKRYEKLAAKVRNGQIDEGNGNQSSTQKEDAETVGGKHAEDVKKLITKSPVTWEEIGGLDQTKREIKFAYGLSMAQLPAGVKMEAWRNIMFYGPPGTGKTLLAGATSNGLDATFFNVKVSSVLSKYFGESTKLISELYDNARRMHPAVVFIDEFESITKARGSGNDTGPERRILSTILAELDGLAEGNETTTQYVMTIAATNAPWDVDKAVLSRFQNRVFIPLPDLKAREQILKINLSDRNIPCDIELRKLAEMMRMYSGREISSICKIAALAMIQERNREIPDLVDRGRNAVSDYRMKIRGLTEKDFVRVMKDMPPGTPEKPDKPFEQWVTNTPVD